MVAEKGSGFDPERVRKEVRDAGFTAVDIEITAVGPLSREEDFLVLELPHEPKRLVLAGGEKFDDLVAAIPDTEGKIRVRGLLHPSHGHDPPGLTVEWWALESATYEDSRN